MKLARPRENPHPTGLRPVDLPHKGGGKKESHNPNIAFAIMFFWISFEPP
jgi:hypothetical protein